MSKKIKKGFKKFKKAITKKPLKTFLAVQTGGLSIAAKKALKTPKMKAGKTPISDSGQGRDEAKAKRDAEEAAKRRRRRSATLLTGDTGLIDPRLGSILSGGRRLG